MEFQTKIILISLAFSFIMGLITIPILKKLKVGQIERDDGPESHLKKQGTPTMGGIIIILGIVVIMIEEDIGKVNLASIVERMDIWVKIFQKNQEAKE